MLLDLHYVLTIVRILRSDGNRQILLKACHFTVEAVCDLFQSVLHFVYSYFVVHGLLSPVFQVNTACVQRLLNLADDVVFHLALTLRNVVHNLFMRTFNHFANHFDILLTLFHHFLHVNLDFVLQVVASLHHLLSLNFLLALEMAQRLVLLFNLLCHLFLVFLKLIRQRYDPIHQILLSTMRKLIKSLVHLSPNITDTLIDFQVNLVGHL